MPVTSTLTSMEQQQNSHHGQHADSATECSKLPAWSMRTAAMRNLQAPARSQCSNNCCALSSASFWSTNLLHIKDYVLSRVWERLASRWRYSWRSSALSLATRDSKWRTVDPQPVDHCLHMFVEAWQCPKCSACTEPASWDVTVSGASHGVNLSSKAKGDVNCLLYAHPAK